MSDLLKCLFCGREENFYPNDFFCPVCRQPMILQTAFPGKLKIDPGRGSGLDQFSPVLPLQKIRPELSLGEGQTPLLKLHSLDNGVEILAKLESANPTLSFKDRGSAVVVQKVLELGWPAIGTVSTGNMASSTAAYAARAGLPCLLLVKKGTSTAALLSSAVFNPIIIEVGGDYGQLFRQSYDLGKELNIYFANSVDPLRIEGYKLVSFEICWQLGRRPDFVYLPVSSGGHFLGLLKGFREMMQAGYIDRLPVLIGVQAAGCAPIAAAYRAGQEKVVSITDSRTIAHSISNPDPPAGNLVLKLVRENNGCLTTVTDDEMLQAQKYLANKEGIFVQPESATTLAAFFKHRKRFRGTSVLILTGQGLKAVHQPGLKSGNYRSASLQELKEVIRSTLAMNF